MKCSDPNACSERSAPDGMKWCQTKREFVEGDAYCFVCRRRFMLVPASGEGEAT